MKDIFDIQDNVILSVPVLAENEHAEELMRTDEVRMFWNSDENTTLPVGAYVEVGGEKYSLIEPYKPSQKKENMWRYEPVFVSAFYALSKVPFYMYTYDGGVIGANNILSREADWVLTDNAYNFLDTLRQAIENETGDKYAIAVAQDLPASKTVTFSSVDILSALNAISSAFETEFWLEKYDTPNQNQQIGCIHLSFANDGATAKVLTVGTNINVPSVTEGKEGFFNRFVVLGSTRNITQDYQGAGVNSITNKRLTLNPDPTTGYPNGYIDYAGGGKPYTKILVFDDIYPVSNLRIKTGGVLVEYRYVLDDNDNPIELRDGVFDQFAVYYVKLEKYENDSWSDFSFNNTDYDEESNPGGMRLPNLKVSLHFNSGPLTGREFELRYLDSEETHNDKASVQPFSCPGGYFEIQKTQEGDYIIPALTGLVPGAHDEVVLFNIKMPDTYVFAAQSALRDAAFEEIGKKYLQLNNDGTARTDSHGNLLRVDLNSYQFISNPVAFGASNPDLKIASNITYVNGAYSLSTRVKSLVTKLDFPVKQTITIGEELTKGTLQELKDEAANANQNIDLLDALSSSTQRLLDAYNRTQELIQARLIDNFFQINGNLGTLVELRSNYSYLGPKKGLVFEITPEESYSTSPAHLMLRNLGTTQSPNYALYTPLPLITGGDQIVIDGTPGQGGGGSSELYVRDLRDFDNSISSRPTANNMVLVYRTDLTGNDGNAGAWTYVSASEIGGVTSVVKGSAVSGGAVTTSGGVVTIQFPTAYSLPLASNGTRGGIRIGYAENGKNYPVELSSEKAFVNVPWTDTLYKLTLNGATKGASDGTDLGSFYAPTAGGASGKVLLGQGATTAPDWSGFTLSGTASASYALNTISSNASNGNTAYGYFSESVLPVSHGGTGFSSYAKGNILYASNANTLAKLAPNTGTKKFLTMASSVPSWGNVDEADVFGSAAIGSTSLPVYYTGSALATITDLDLLNETTGYVKANKFYLTSDVYFYTETINEQVCVRLNAPFITSGDQIVISGTPGQGGGGGGPFLSNELLDAGFSAMRTNNVSNDGKMLIWSKNATGSDGLTGAWVTIDQSSITPDLSGYYTKTETDSAISTAISGLSSVYQSKYSFTISGTSGGNYNLDNFLTSIPVASNNTLGGIKVGTNLSINGAGVLSADPYSAGTGLSLTNKEFSLDVNGAKAALELGDLAYEDSLESLTLFGKTYNGSAPISITLADVQDDLDSVYHPLNGLATLDFSVRALETAAAITVGNGATQDANRRIYFGGLSYYLELKDYGTGGTPNLAFHFNAPVVSDGDQVVADNGSVTPGGGSGGGGIPHVAMSQSAWEALSNPDPGTIYLIYES